MNKEIASYLEHIVADYDRWTNQSIAQDPITKRIREQMFNEFKTNIRIDEGSKFFKIVTNGGGGSGGSCHSFIVKNDMGKFKRGDILKAASWRAPAKNFSRGNVLTGNFSNVRWTGC